MIYMSKERSNRFNSLLFPYLFIKLPCHLMVFQGKSVGISLIGSALIQLLEQQLLSVQRQEEGVQGG